MASLPESLVGRHVFVLDPMLATGGSLVHCCGLLTERGARRRSPCSARWPRRRACARLEESGLPLRVFTASVDEGLNEQGLHRPGPRRRGRPPVRRGLTMRFGVLGTGFWAKEVHAATLAAHPSAELVGVWGRDLAKAKAVGAEFDVAGYDDVDALLAQVDAVALAAAARRPGRRWPSGPRRPASTCCWRSRSPCPSRPPTGW